MPSIVNQIQNLENNIKQCEDRLDIIDRSLRLQELTDDERNSFQEEESQLQKQLKGHEKDLSSMRKENFKSMVVSCIVLAVIYGLYVSFWS